MEIEKVSFPNREAYSENYFKKLYQKYSEGFIVAENEGKIIGYTIGRPKNESAEIISLAIHPNWRQKGVGRNLTNFLINHLKESGFKEIFLHVRTRNQVAISFYKESGFNVLKKIKNYYQNGDDAYLMKKKLDG